MFLSGIFSLYSPLLAAALIAELQSRQYSALGLFDWFWTTKTYRSLKPLSDTGRSLAVLLALGMLTQIGFGIGLLVQWARFGTTGTWEFGLALLLSYPLVWAHVAVLFAAVGNVAWAIAHPKQAGRVLICGVFEWQVRRLRRRHHFKVVAVVGSVGKTSTKLAIADLLGQTMRVRHQAGNYNDRVTVPLVLFGLTLPPLYNIFAWAKAFGAAQAQISLSYPYDVVVVELGTDGPGQIAEFAYLRPDITVVTAVSPEHMEYFGTLDAVAAEELSVFDYSKRVLVNGDDIAGTYLAGRSFTEYSLTSAQAEYGAAAKPKGLAGQTLQLRLLKASLEADIAYVGEPGAKVALAAAAVADMLGVKPADIAAGLPQLKPFAGRMQILTGVSDATLIDDTYNASPLAVKAALDTLYAARAKQRIAILGSMNELGVQSHKAHWEIGEYCDPKKLSLVVTIGHDAKRWLAPAAEKRGCDVHEFSDPFEAGEFVKSKLQTGAVVLAKGSQNGVFAEEALKPLLADMADEAKLVRQSPHWLKVKAKQFHR